MKFTYGKFIGKNLFRPLTDGMIVAPSGWEIIPEGDPIPQVHMSYIVNPPFGRDRPEYGTEEYWKSWTGIWSEPKRCHSTMTPPNAGVCGHVLAYARRIH